INEHRLGEAEGRFRGRETVRHHTAIFGIRTSPSREKPGRHLYHGLLADKEGGDRVIDELREDLDAIAKQLFVNGYQQLIPQAIPQAAAKRLGPSLLQLRPQSSDLRVEFLQTVPHALELPDARRLRLNELFNRCNALLCVL